MSVVWWRRALCGLLLIVTMPGTVVAQTTANGHIAALLDVLPAVPATNGEDRRAVLELRARVFTDVTTTTGEHVRFRLAGFVEGLAADRAAPGGTATDAILRGQEAYAEFAWERAEVRAGYSRIVWGRLDELQPTDVVNPLDLSRFFFEGRAEARMAVALVRGRLFLPGGAAIEGLVVPAFRQGRFDQLDEPASPFNLLPAVSTPLVETLTPAVTWRNVQGGARVLVTTGRVDWAVSAYRGFEPFPLVGGRPIDPLALPAPGTPFYTATFPRFTMIGGDFETVQGPWGIRGEVAMFVDDSFQATSPGPGEGPEVVPGRSFDAGIGVDRKAGAFRLAGDVLVRRRAFDPLPAGVAEPDRTDVNLIVAADRTFERETRRLQVFGVLDPTEGTAFFRGIGTVKLVDTLALEVSGGWFMGTGPDVLGQFTDRDFAYARLKYYF